MNFMSKSCVLFRQHNSNLGWSLTANYCLSLPYGWVRVRIHSKNICFPLFNFALLVYNAITIEIQNLNPKNNLKMCLWIRNTKYIYLIRHHWFSTIKSTLQILSLEKKSDILIVYFTLYMNWLNQVKKEFHLFVFII